jgi:hypothetical protein
MFLREIRETLKQVVSVLSFLAVMPLVYILDRSFYETGTTITEYLLGGFALLWLIAAGYLAYNMFRLEDKDDAEEYVLSLPVGCLKLLIWKTIPRAVVLILLLPFFNFGRTIWFYSIIGCFVFVLFSQVSGFTLGIVGRSSWITRLILLVMNLCAFIISSIPPRFIMPGNLFASGVIFAITELIFLALILIPVYRVWDIRPVRFREQSFAKWSAVPMITLAIPVVVIFSS